MENKSENVYEIPIEEHANPHDETPGNLENNREQYLRKSDRERKKPAKLSDENFVYNNVVYVNYVNANNPINFI